MPIAGNVFQLLDPASGYKSEISAYGLKVDLTGIATTDSIALLSTEATQLLVKAAIEDVTAALGASGTIHGDLGTINTSLGTINTSLGTINTSVGAVTTAVTSSNTKLDTLHTDITSSNTKLDTLHTDVAANGTKLDTVHSDLGTINTSLGTVNTSVQAVKTSVDAVKTSTDAVKTSVDALKAASAATLSQPTASTTTQVLLALNTSRRGAVILNKSNKILYVAFAATATTSAYTAEVFQGNAYELSTVPYTGIISAISPAGASGSILVTELTA